MVENKHVSPDKIKALLNVLVEYNTNVIRNSGTCRNTTRASVNEPTYVATDIYTKSVAKHVFPLITNFGLATNMGDTAFDAMAVINVGYDLSGVNPSYQNCSSQFEYYGISLKNHNNVNGIIKKSSIQLTPDINRSIVDVLLDRNTDKPYRSYKTVLVLTDIIDTLDYRNKEDMKIIDGIIELATLFDFTYLTFSEMHKRKRCRYYPFKYKSETRYRVIPNYCPSPDNIYYSPLMYANVINARIIDGYDGINEKPEKVGDSHMFATALLDDDLVVIDRGLYNYNDCIDNNGFTKMFDDKDEKDAYLSANNVAPIYKHMITV